MSFFYTNIINILIKNFTNNTTNIAIVTNNTTNDNKKK